MTVPDQCAGQKGRCKACNHPLIVPAAATAASAAATAGDTGPIRFLCPSCRRLLRVPARFAGRSSQCPGCSSPVVVPAASTAEAPAPAPPPGDLWAPGAAPPAGVDPASGAAPLPLAAPPDGVGT